MDARRTDGHAPPGATTLAKLTLHLDHSMGAGQGATCLQRRAGTIRPGTPTTITSRSRSRWQWIENMRDRRTDEIGSRGVETIRHIFARVAMTRGVRAEAHILCRRSGLGASAAHQWPPSGKEKLLRSFRYALLTAITATATWPPSTAHRIQKRVEMVIVFPRSASSPALPTY